MSIPEGMVIAGESASAPLRIDLIDPASDEILESKNVEPGDADLARLFPRLWQDKSPKTVLAQLAQGEIGIGPALVLVPMLPPKYAARADRDGSPVFPKENANKPRTLSGYWIFPDQHAVIETTGGELTFRLRPDVAPNSVRNFRELVVQGFYTDIPIHRIASLIAQPRPDIIQFGDPTGTGLGGPGYMIDLEQSTLRHDYGVLSYARASDPNSAGSQVIIGLSREGTAALDGRYAAFGQLVGQGPSSDVLGALAKTEVNPDGKPRNPPVIKRIRLVDAPPHGERPKPLEDPLKRVPAR